jgi:flagellar motility protein MotE (MotC chaperone)
MMPAALMHRSSAQRGYDSCACAPPRAARIGRLSARWGDRLWGVVVGIGVIVALSWTTAQLVHASAEQGLGPRAVQDKDGSSVSAETTKKSGSEAAVSAAELAQGPALFVPEELIAMFQQRKQDLERREQAVRTAEAQVAILKVEIEQILSKVEAIEQRRLDQEKAASSRHTAQSKQAVDLRAQQLGQLAKMYESMPAEEAAARIEKMANRKALEILRLIKTKSAGAILAQVKVDRAAKLTEELLAGP